MTPAAPAKRTSPRAGDRARPSGPPQHRAGRSLVNVAYQILKQRILRNELPAGFQALETEFAAQLRMSRTPIREALQRLQSDGLVELTPRRGARVLPLLREDMREIYQLLCCLEATAAELMAGRALGPASAEIAALEAAARATDDALTRKDLDSWATADEQFHRLLLEHCGNQRLRRMALAVWDQSHRARILTLRLRPWPAESVVEHWATLNAIRRGDSRAAFEIHRAHRMRGMNLILDLLERHGLWQL